MKSIPLQKRIPLIIFSTFIVPISVLAIVHFFNRLLVQVNLFENNKATSFQVSQAKKPASQKLDRPKPKPKKKEVKKDLAPNLDQLLSGSSFGLDSYEWLGKDSFNDELLNGSKNDTLSADKVEQAPVLIQATPPTYPDSARKKGQAGYVTLNLLVTPAGKVESYQIVDSQPPGIFDQAAIQSVKSWTFQAAVDKGRNVAVWVEQKLSFSLN